MILAILALLGFRELHGYDGPLQYLSQGNPDSMTAVQVQFGIGTVGKIRQHDSSPGIVPNWRTVGKIRQHGSSPGTARN